MVDRHLLKQILFLRELPDPVIEKIATIATLETYKKDDVIFYQNQDLTHLYLLYSGKVHLTIETVSGKSLIVDKIFEGRTFGVSALMDESSSAYTAVCAEDSRLIAVPGKEMHRLFEEDFQLGHILMLKVVKLFKKRIELHTRQFLLSLSTHSEIS